MVISSDAPLLEVYAALPYRTSAFSCRLLLPSFTAVCDYNSYEVFNVKTFNIMSKFNVGYTFLVRC